MKTGIELIAEKQKRNTKKGWTPEHDAQHTRFELTQAAIYYAVTGVVVALNAFKSDEEIQDAVASEHAWPFREPFKFDRDVIENLVNAGALIADEINRLQRLSQSEANNE